MAPSVRCDAATREIGRWCAQRLRRRVPSDFNGSSMVDAFNTFRREHGADGWNRRHRCSIATPHRRRTVERAHDVVVKLIGHAERRSTSVRENVYVVTGGRTCRGCRFGYGIRALWTSIIHVFTPYLAKLADPVSAVGPPIHGIPHSLPARTNSTHTLHPARHSRFVASLTSCCTRKHFNLMSDLSPQRLG